MLILRYSKVYFAVAGGGKWKCDMFEELIRREEQGISGVRILFLFVESTILRVDCSFVLLFLALANISV